jgi:hypothetical protein
MPRRRQRRRICGMPVNDGRYVEYPDDVDDEGGDDDIYVDRCPDSCYCINVVIISARIFVSAWL